jgi:mono/diheme cytochrome c family protein
MKGLFWAVAAMAVAATGPAYADDGPFWSSKNCGSCHALTKPTDASFDRIWTRKGPDLWYAGDKFNQDWLVGWLQDPKPIRPAGYPYFKTIEEGTEHDEVDPSKITPHPKLLTAEAARVAAALMTLKGPPDLVPQGSFKGDMAGARMGALSFTKLRGCSACHQGAGGKGGTSGPELTDAGTRLRPDFIAAYTADPQRFDPHVWMPTLKLNDKDIQRLTGYLIGLTSGDKK